VGAFGEDANIMETHKETSSRKNLKRNLISTLIKLDLFKALQ